MTSKVAVVVGVGPGLGRSIALKFAKEGYKVALIARNKDKLEPVEKEIIATKATAISVPADTADVNSISNAFKHIRETLGSVDVLIYNAGSFKRGPVHELKSEEFENAWKVGCFGAFLSVQQVINDMLKNSKGTVIFTGATASLRGGPNFAAFASAKFALRALAMSSAKDYAPKGIHIAHVIIDGQVYDSASVKQGDATRAKDSYIQPDAVAELYYQLHSQPASAWTFEIDVRPSVEKW